MAAPHPTLIKTFWPAAIIFTLILTAILFRPLLPIDETRYMTVAWEMHLHHGWFKPLTLNFAPYHHKPPMLFWLINLSWGLFGISRWAGLVPVALVSTAAILLTVQLGRKILPPDVFNAQKIAIVMLGSVPFLIYGTLVMFDMTVMVFVLLTLLSLIHYAQERKAQTILWMALFIGLGLLTKGPVAWLYVLFPMLLGPFWIHDFSKPVSEPSVIASEAKQSITPTSRWNRLPRFARNDETGGNLAQGNIESSKKLSWYGGCALALLLSILPLLVWLIPVLQSSSQNFAFWLLWEQTAGRITGNFNDAHVRPVYFYLPLLPVMLLPWILFPAFWRGLKNTAITMPAIRFLLCWAAPTFLCFCFISGKQPHYLVPLLPAAILLTALCLHGLRQKTMAIVLSIMLVLVTGGQIIASRTALKDYNLIPIATSIQQNPTPDYAFVHAYHGEIGFLARLEKPVTDLKLDQVNGWLATHPDGRVIIRYKSDDEIAPYEKIMTLPYRGKNIGIFKAK